MSVHLEPPLLSRAYRVSGDEGPRWRAEDEGKEREGVEGDEEWGAGLCTRRGYRKTEGSPAPRAARPACRPRLPGVVAQLHPPSLARTPNPLYP